MMTLSRVVLAVTGSAFAALVAIPIVAIALPFWLMAVLTRAFLPLCQPSIVQGTDLFEFHRTLGWKAKPNLSLHCLEERDDIFHVTTDANGWPGRRTLAESRVVVFGDSFAFGYGVDAKRAFFEINPAFPIKAIGVPGYSMVQELLVMEELSSSLKGKMVVWFVYFGNDLYDNLSPEMTQYRSPFVAETASGDWTIVTRHINQSKWSCSVGRQGRQRLHIPEKFFRKSALGDRAYSVCEFLLSKGRDICDRAGATLVVMTIPTSAMLEPTPTVCGKPVDASYPDGRIRAICEKLQSPVICLRDVLTRADYKESDEHWNEEGHRKVMQVISELYGSTMPLRPQSNGIPHTFRHPLSLTR